MTLTGFSRQTGSLRRATLAAAGFMMLLVAQLLVTAGSTLAASTCSAKGAELQVSIGANESLVLAVGDGGTAPTGIPTAAGSYSFSQNGGPLVACGGASSTASIAVVMVTGSVSGAESITLFHPDGGGPGESMASENLIVDLGNGEDSLRVNYGGSSAIEGGPFDGSSMPAAPRLLTGSDGSLVGDLNGDGVGDFETQAYFGGLILDESDVARPGETGSQFWLSRSEFSARSVLEGTADDVAAADSGGVAASTCVGECGQPFARPVTVNAGDGDDVFHSGGGDDIFNGGQGTNTLDVSAAPAAVDVVIEEAPEGVASGTAKGGLGTDALTSVQNFIGSGFDDEIQTTAEKRGHYLSGQGGTGRIDAGSGDDVVHVVNPYVGEDWKAVIAGGTGDDRVLVTNNLNVSKCCPAFALQGGAGEDVLRMVNDGTGKFGPISVLRGGPGDDILSSAESHEADRSNVKLIVRLDGGPGEDTCKGHGSNDNIDNCEGRVAGEDDIPLKNWWKKRKCEKEGGAWVENSQGKGFCYKNLGTPARF